MSNRIKLHLRILNHGNPNLTVLVVLLQILQTLT